MQVSNFNFTHSEEEVISQQEFFLLKHAATKKIIDLFGSIEKGITSELNHHIIEVAGLNKTNGKIFRGENYKLFPYIVLDCPKLFSTSSIFAYRTMFWWGHEFSFTLHLQGAALEMFRKNISERLDDLKGKGVYYCVNDTPWQYHFERDNYHLIENVKSIDGEINSKPFLKLSRKVSVEEHAKVFDYAMETLQLFLDLLSV